MIKRHSSSFRFLKALRTFFFYFLCILAFAIWPVLLMLGFVGSVQVDALAQLFLWLSLTSVVGFLVLENF